MAERKKRAAVSWATCKAAMKVLPQGGVVELVHELYRLSEQNRTFLHARLLALEGTAAAADVAAGRLRKLLSPAAADLNRFRHVDCERVVDAFDKATDDKAAVARLLVLDLATAFETFVRVGDVEPMVDHCYATMARLDTVLLGLPPAAATEVVERMSALERKHHGAFGYGFSDDLAGQVKAWRERFARAGPPAE